VLVVEEVEEWRSQVKFTEGVADAGARTPVSYPTVASSSRD
jgi:hypothetical protein